MTMQPSEGIALSRKINGRSDTVRQPLTSVVEFFTTTNLSVRIASMPRSDADHDAQIESLSLLRDPLRRAIYRYVARAAEPVSRDDVAGAVDASRSLVAFHLDKLVDNGLLRPSFRRLSGRTGPGAGRPAKLYERSDAQLEVTLPAREYELAAQLLLQALEGGGRAGSGERLQAAARQLGETSGAEEAARGGAPRSRRATLERLQPVLEGLGYEPALDSGSIRLRNCPFHALAQRSTTTVCGMNLALLEGLLDGLQAKGVAAQLAPAADRCCVEISANRP
jgi:predicted ArsR family transcriptional regulator